MSAPDDIEVLGTAEAGPAVIRGGVLRILGYLGGILLSVGAAALLFRHLGVEDGGRYVTVVSLMGIVAGVSDVGLSAVAMRELSVLGARERRELMRHLLGMRIAVTVAGCALALVFTVAAGYDRVLVLGTLLASVGLVVQSIQSLLTTPLQAALRLGWVTSIELARNVVTVALTIALVALGAELLPFLAVSIGAALATLALTVPLIRETVSWRPSFQLSAWAPLVRSTLALALATAIASVYFRVSVLVMSIVAGKEQTGYFGASFRIVEILTFLPLMAISAAFPLFSRAARDDRARLAYAVQRSFETCLVFGAALALALALGAPFAIEVVAGPDFQPAADVLRIQSLALFFSCTAALWAYVLASMRHHRELVAITSTTLVLSIALTLVLEPPLGAEGAAWATVICEMVASLGAAGLLVRSDPALRRLSLRAVPRVALAAALGGAVVLVPGLGDVARALIGTVVFGAAAVALRAVPEELRIEARRAVSNPRRRG